MTMNELNAQEDSCSECRAGSNSYYRASRA